jgi:hypothetical protein
MALQFGRQRPSQDDIGARPEGQMQVGFTRDLHAAWIDHHQPGALLAGAVDDRHEMEL